jgi:LuxR family transcriptional regulator, maltose regulon positive regulatory protein
MRTQFVVTLGGRLPTQRDARTLDGMSVGAPRATGATRGSRARREAAPFTPLPWKLQPPAVRPGIVPRTALVERMLAASAVPVVSITGPPGYGKTSLLAQWTERSARPVASLLLDPADNDPAVLLAYLAHALDRAEPIDVDACCARIPHGSSTAGTIAHRVVSALDGMTAPVVVALDNADSVRNPACRDAIDAIATHLPPAAQLVVVARGETPLALSRLRSTGRLLEIGADDLAMDAGEAAALVTATGAPIGPEHLAVLVGHTEGWPVGLYLAALAARDGGRGGGAGHAFSGDDRLMADYLRAELLDRLPARTVGFLTRSSVLDRMSGAVCDDVLGTTGSGALLQSLERANLLVVPLDRRGEWFRYHHLLADLLRAELELREPRLAARLHARAADWFAAAGEPDRAIRHAQESRDPDRVAVLVGQEAIPAYSAGRVETCLTWLQWFEDRQLLEAYPSVAVLGAVVHSLLGHDAAAEVWSAAALGSAVDTPPPDGSSLAAWRAALRGLAGRDGVAQMQLDAQEALDGLSADSLLRPAALLLSGVAFLLDDEPGRADTVLGRAADAARHMGSLPAGSVALAERALLAIDRRDWAAAESLAVEAALLVEAGALDDYVSSALVHAVAARTALHRGDVEAARAGAAHVARLRVGLTAAVPFFAVQTRLELVQAYLELADAAGARLILREVRDLLHMRPDLGSLAARADRLRDQLEAMGPGTVGATSLTTAELRLLPLLPTHLTFREIGERLHVSRHTIKTQAMSVYRKLGVSSRGEAIDRVQQVGLLAR